MCQVRASRSRCAGLIVMVTLVPAFAVMLFFLFFLLLVLLGPVTLKTVITVNPHKINRLAACVIPCAVF